MQERGSIGTMMVHRAGRYPDGRSTCGTLRTSKPVVQPLVSGILSDAPSGDRASCGTSMVVSPEPTRRLFVAASRLVCDTRMRFRRRPVRVFGEADARRL